MNIENVGQNTEQWSQHWSTLTPESEIRMWDFYGGRQWISKYIPRHGKTLEAGCGLGRYNFYFFRMGIDIEGIDFSKSTIDYLNNWKTKYGFNNKFNYGDITDLPYESSSLRGYISLGVVEHFIEGPHKAIAEAFRVLEPGGIAIITTPSISWFVFKEKLKAQIKDTIKRFLFRPNTIKKFFQYEYRPLKLKHFVEQSGLKVTAYDCVDLLYTFTELGNFTDNKIRYGSFGYWFSNTFENTFLRKLGAQSITISVKTAPKMYCFLCGLLKADLKSLDYFTVPICNECKNDTLQKYYRHGIIARFARPYLINPPLKKPQKERCYFSGKEYWTDELFEDYGFTKKVSPEMLKNITVNLELCNNFVQPIWRSRVSKNSTI